MTTQTVVVQAPPSKSLSHRTLIAAALANGSSVVDGALNSDDITRTRGCLEACGASIEEQDGSLVVQGMEHGPKGGGKGQEPAELFMHESGTTCRLMTGVAAAGKGTFHVHGAPRMHQRPMAELTKALGSLGCAFNYEGEPGHLPFVMETKGFHGKQVDITLEESSQYLSGLLLGAPLGDKPLTVAVTGKKAVSWPYVALTLRIMEDFKAGFTVETLQDGAWVETPWRTIKSAVPNEIRFQVRPTGYQPTNYRVEGDWSNASYFLAAGAVGKATTQILGVNVDSLQGDRAILDILAQMGAGFNVSPGKGVTIFPRALRGVDVDMGRCPDLVPTVAVAAAFAVSPTIIRNVAHLRIKESDRLQACADEIAKTGCGTEVFEDGIKITPAPLPKGKTIEFNTYGDHRIAMSMSLFELAGIEVKLDNPGCVGKSFPNFFEEWDKVRAALG